MGIDREQSNTIRNRHNGHSTGYGRRRFGTNSLILDRELNQ